MASNVKPDDLSQRTFKIIRRPPDGLAYAISVAEKYRLTRPATRRRGSADEGLSPASGSRLRCRARACPPTQTTSSGISSSTRCSSAMAPKDELVLKVAKARPHGGDLERRRDHRLPPGRAQGLPGQSRDCPAALRPDGRGFQRAEEIWQAVLGILLRASSTILSRGCGFSSTCLRNSASWPIRHSADFRSEGFSNLFAMLARELDDDYFALIDKQLNRLNFRDGVLVSAGLGRGSGAGITSCAGPSRPEGTGSAAPSADFRMAAAQGALSTASSRRLHALSRAPRRSGRAGDLGTQGPGRRPRRRRAGQERRAHRQLLSDAANRIGVLRRLPEPARAASRAARSVHLSHRERRRRRAFASKDLYDICLALSMNKRPVGNEIEADGKSLIVVTGANQGGKTTFLRSFGLAQLMTQCGHVRAGREPSASTSWTGSSPTSSGKRTRR